MGCKPVEKTENWLLIKGEEDAARREGEPDILEERPESVKTGRVVEQVAGEAPGWSSETGRIERREKKPAKKNDAGKPAKKAASAPRRQRGPARLKGAKASPLPAFEIGRAHV